MTIKTELAVDQDYIRSFSQEKGEPTWLTELREKAFETAKELPLPKPDKTKIQRWNFTQFTDHSVQNNKYESLDQLPKTVKSLVDLENKNQNLYIQHNHTPAYLSVTEDLKNKGVIFTDIFTAAKEHSDLLKKYYMTDVVKIDEHKLTALHAALMNGGAFLYVPKNVEVTEPIQSVFIHDHEKAPLFNHVIIVAEDNSSVTYVENYISTVETADSIANIVSEVFAGTNAKIAYGAVDHLAKGVTSYVNRRAVAGRDARIEVAHGAMNDGDSIVENTTNLVGDGSYGDTKIVVVGRGSQTQNFTTQITHFGKHTEGYILKHGVMGEEATAIFNGIGKIEENASKSNAEQESRILMLSEKARGDANPILLIDEDDVTAGHAASVGRVDEKQIYYLMSRGISKTEAERLIIHGFLAPVVEQLHLESVKKQFTDLIERKIK